MRERSLGIFAISLVSLLYCGCAANLPGVEHEDRYRRGQALYEQGKYVEALGELKPLLIGFPRWPEPSLLYARSAQATGTIEGRNLASQVLAKLVSSHPKRADIRHQLASLKFEQGFYVNAKAQYEKLLKQNRDDTTARYMLAAALEREWKRYRNRKDLVRIIAELTRVTELDSLNADAFRRLAVAYLEKQEPDSMGFTAERFLRLFPSNRDALMLRAISLHQNLRYEECLKGWETLFSLLSQSEKSTYNDISLLLTPPEKTRFKHMDSESQERYVRNFWKELDPTPISRLNERLLEHWRRVGLSKILFSDMRRGTPGWKTAPGEVLIRYGLPDEMVYTFSPSGAGSMAFPALVWYYSAGNDPVEIVFVDYCLSGNFEFFGFSKFPTTLDRMAYYRPSFYEHDYGATVFENFFAAAGFLRGQAVREEFYLGVPLEMVGGSDWRRVPYEIAVFDTSWNEVARANSTLEDTKTYATGGVGGVLVSQLGLELKPGRYIVAATVTDSVSGTLGLTKQSVEVPGIAPRGFGVSEIELAYQIPEKRFGSGISKDEGILPNPSGIYAVPEPVRLYYEVYDLTPGGDGVHRFVTKYSIVPFKKKGSSFLEFVASVFRGGQHYIVSSFERQVESASSSEQLSIDISTLRDGSYRLVLEIQDLVSGQSVQRERLFDKIPASDSPPVGSGKGG